MNLIPRQGQSAIVLLFWLSLASLVADTRTWISVDGRELEAELVRVEGDSVVLRRMVDWRVFTIPIKSLSEADQEYLKQYSESDAKREDIANSSRIFPENGLTWPRTVEAPGDFEVEILEEDNERGIYRYRSGHFVFTSDIKLARKVVSDFAEIFEGTYLAVRAMPLNWRIEAPLEGYAVQLFGERSDYEAAGGLPGSGGIYLGGQRVILVPMDSLGVKKSSSGVTLDGEGGHGTLIHEITHQVQHDWLSRMPVWMVEGFAEYVEAVPYARGEFDFDDLEPLEALRTGGRVRDEFFMIEPKRLMTMNGTDWNSSFGADSLTVRKQYASAFLLVYYFAHLDGEGDGRRLWEALRILESARTREEWQDAQSRARKALLDGRSYPELFEDMQRTYRSEGIKLLGEG